MYNIKLFISLYDYNDNLTAPKWVDFDVETYYVYLVNGGSISVDSTENIVSHAVFKKTAIERIVAKAYSDGNSNEGRKADGTFGRWNSCAEKFHIKRREFYLLYMLCGSQVVVAEKLGVCRQTVGRRLKRCDGILDEVKAIYGVTRWTDPNKMLWDTLHDDVVFSRKPEDTTSNVVFVDEPEDTTSNVVFVDEPDEYALPDWGDILNNPYGDIF